MANEPNPKNGSGGGGESQPAGYSDGEVRALVNSAARQAARLTASSLLVDRKKSGQGLARISGKSFWSEKEGVYKRDLWDALGYEENLTVHHYRSRFERGGVATRIVTAPASATWAGGFDLIEDPDPGQETPFEAAVIELFSRLGVWDRLLRADILAGLGRYGVIYIGAPGEDTEPLRRVRGPEEIFYLTALAEDRAEVLKEVEDVNDPRYGQPELYKINAGSGLTGKLGRGAGRNSNEHREVHASRIIHVADGLLEDEVCGEPRLRAAWNLLDDLDKIVGGGAEAAWKRQDPGMALKLPPEAQTTDPEAPNYFDVQEAEDEVTEYMHGARRFMRLHGVDLDVLEAGVTSFSPNANSVLKLISATKGIPERILTGSERGELASSQDRSNWADRTQERRRFFAEPLVRALTDHFIDLRALPQPGEPYIVGWPDIDELNESEKAEVADKLADANSKQADADGTLLVSNNEIRDRVFQLGPMEEIDTEGEESSVEEDEEEKEEEEAAARDEALAAARHGPSPAHLRVAKRQLQRRIPKRRRGARASGHRAAADREELRLVQRVADSNIPRIVALFLAFWAAMASSIEAQALEGNLEIGNEVGALGLIEQSMSTTEEEWTGRVQERIQGVLVEAGEGAARAAQRRGSWLRSASGAGGGDSPFRAADLFETQFDAVDPRVTRWAATRSSGMITEIGPETRLAMRELITAGVAQGVPPGELAKQIRQSVGLRSDQVTAVNNLRDELSSARPGTLVTRFPPAPSLRGQPGFRVRIPKGGLSEAQVEKRLAKYREMQRNLRARTIARTETMRAANVGQRQAWLQAVDKGQLPKDQKRVWITAGDSAVRDLHAVLGGEVVGLDEPFSLGFEPGEEPNCRCSQGLATKKDLERAESPEPREFDLLEDFTSAPDEMSAEFHDWAKSLSAEEARALRSYQGAGFQDVNEALRTGKSIDLLGFDDRLVQDLKNSVGRARLAKNTKLFRAVETGPEEFLRRFPVGSEFSEKAFTSTSFFSHKGKSPFAPNAQVQLEVSAPAGTKGAYVAATTGEKFIEGEILLQAGTKFRVVAAEEVGDHLKVFMEVIEN